MALSGKRAALIVLLTAVVLALSWYLWTQRTSRAAAPSNAYVDARQCRACHAKIFDTYQQVGMARSFRSRPEVRKASFIHQASGRHYEVVERDGRMFQRRYELDGKGHETNAFELQATHVIGSGNHARTYVHQAPSGEMIELPLSWYAEQQTWHMSPGYDSATPQDFTRLIDDSCLFCHNGYPKAAGELAQGIDCQRCHGPGAEHVRWAGASNPDTTKIRQSIVNPKRLSSDLQMDVCMQCHLETTSAELPEAIRRFDREPFSYRPGAPLGSYIVHFDHPKGTGHDDKFEIVNQAYRLRQSACFRGSAGRMTCSSCHDPHNVPRGADAVAWYRGKCMACHVSVAAKDHPDLRTADCSPCHMPKRRAEDAVHVVMTDHLIQRKRPAGDLTKPLQERPSIYRGPLVVYWPETLSPQDHDLYLGSALVSGGADRKAGIALLEKSTSGDTPAKALAVLGEGYLAEKRTNDAISVLQRAFAAQPTVARVHYNLALALDAAGRTTEARAAFERAIELQAVLPEAEYALANLLSRTGEAVAAEAHYASALRARPVYVEAKINLGNLYASTARLDDARRQLEEAVRIDPGSPDAQNNLARVLTLQGHFAEALPVAKRAVKLKPNFPEARYNLGRLLQETGATEAALAEYRALLASSPSMVEAHLAYGQLLGDIGRLDAAAAEFREVLRLRPGHAEAQRNLEMALQMKGGAR